MKLTCEGCGTVISADGADALHAAMMRHGEEVHTNFFEGKTADEIVEMRQSMDAHVAKLIAEQT